MPKIDKIWQSVPNVKWVHMLKPEKIWESLSEVEKVWSSVTNVEKVLVCQKLSMGDGVISANYDFC